MGQFVNKEHLHTLIDTLLPADEALNMPSASQVGVDAYVRQHGLETLYSDFVRIVEKTGLEKYGLSWLTMTDAQRLVCVNACKLVNIRLFSEVVSHLFKAYYSSPEVLAKIKSGSVPPFPSGNPLPSDDWSLLEPVYERGLAYRLVPSPKP
jgi:hypothetical protein